MPALNLLAHWATVDADTARFVAQYLPLPSRAIALGIVTAEELALPGLRRPPLPPLRQVAAVQLLLNGRCNGDISANDRRPA